MADLAIDAVLQQTLAQARAKPADVSTRMKLFRLFVVTGQWERAANQLSVADGLDSELAYSTLVYRGLVAGERFRAEVFAGRRTPVVVGEPAPWLGWMVQALGAESASAASQLREQALEHAPAVPGSIDGDAFDWVADADSRVGPVFEAFIDGKYYWIPFAHLKEVTFEPPNDWLDMVWASAQVTFVSGGTRPAHVPARYVGSEAGDDQVRLSRATRWDGDDIGGYRGLGQRVLTTDRHEVGLLDVRRLVVDSHEPAKPADA